MRVKVDGLWFCADCASVAANGDSSGMEDDRAAHVEARVAEYGPHLVPTSGSDDSGLDCDCCGEFAVPVAHQFAVLTDWSTPPALRAQVKAQARCECLEAWLGDDLDEDDPYVLGRMARFEAHYSHQQFTGDPDQRDDLLAVWDEGWEEMTSEIARGLWTQKGSAE